MGRTSASPAPQLEAEVGRRSWCGLRPVARSLGRQCDNALHAGARRKGIVAVADAARSRPVETNRRVESVLAALLKPDGSHSRLLSDRSRASTDAAVHRHAGPADRRQSHRSAAAASPSEGVASSRPARALPQLVRRESRPELRADFCFDCAGRLLGDPRAASTAASDASALSPTRSRPSRRLQVESNRADSGRPAAQGRTNSYQPIYGTPPAS